MKDGKPTAAGTAPPDAEPFLERWSRRKAQARAGIDDEAGEATGEAAPTEPPAGPRPAAQAPPPLPDLDSLDADSDYSAFMAQGVDESLRRDALRKLFRSPKFNVQDGLDDYCDDFTQWKELGDIVTADMRHQLERAARLAERTLEEGAGPEPSAATAAVPVEPANAPAPNDESSSSDPAEQHERPERPA